MESNSNRTFSQSSALPLLRPVVDGDEEFLYRVFVAVHGLRFASLPLPKPTLDNLLSLQFRGQQSSYRAQYPNGCEYIVTQGEECVGSLLLATSAAEVRLVNIALLPEWQRRGIGTQVLRDLMAAATPQRPLRLSVGSDNEGALRLYRALGFVVTEQGQTHWQMQWAGPA